MHENLKKLSQKVEHFAGLVNDDNPLAEVVTGYDLSSEMGRKEFAVEVQELFQAVNEVGAEIIGYAYDLAGDGVPINPEATALLEKLQEQDEKYAVIKREMRADFGNFAAGNGHKI